MGSIWFPANLQDLSLQVTCTSLGDAHDCAMSSSKVLLILMGEFRACLNLSNSNFKTLILARLCLVALGPYKMDE